MERKVYKMKKFYRVANIETNQGLWYDQEGEFTGLIHGKFDFCKNSSLEMPFDLEAVGFLSATETIQELHEWFPKEDILKLQQHGYFITVYVAKDYKYHNNHWLINQRTSKAITKLEIPHEVHETTAHCSTAEV